jgi:hypothetical protein
MTLQRMDNVGVEDMDAVAFFTELGMEGRRQGADRGPLGGPGRRTRRSPQHHRDAHPGRPQLKLAQYHTPRRSAPIAQPAAEHTAPAPGHVRRR